MLLRQCAKFLLAMTFSICMLPAMADEYASTAGQSKTTSATTKVSITADDRVWSPSEEATSYRSKCLDHAYELRIDPQGRKVSFSSSGDASRISDITSSQFAQTLLNKKFYTRVAITCYKEYANVFMMGYDNSSGKPLPITESLLVNNDSTIAGDSGLHYEEAGYIESKKMR